MHICDSFKIFFNDIKILVIPRFILTIENCYSRHDVLFYVQNLYITLYLNIYLGRLCLWLFLGKLTIFFFYNQ